MAEYWDIYDANRQLTGKTIKRGEPFGENEFYVCCEVWIVNSKNQMLVTQRHPDKKAGGQWEFTGGGVLAGETTLLAAIREVQEEEILLDEKEVTHWKWLSKDEIEQFIADGKMVRSVGMRYEMFGKELI